MTFILKTLTKDELLECVTSVKKFEKITAERIEEELEYRTELGHILHSQTSDGEEVYTISPTWIRDATHLRLILQSVEDLTKIILNSLIESSNGFASIILGTQKTKTAQMLARIKMFLELVTSEDRNVQNLVPVVYIRNDLELKDQTVIRFMTTLCNNYNASIFIMASGKMSVPDEFKDRIISNPNPSAIRDRLVAYAHGAADMPIFISLPNKTQRKHLEENLYKIIKERPLLNLRHSTFFDEADEIYPQLRNTLLQYFVTNNEEVLANPDTQTVDTAPENYKVYYVTATPEDLFEYPEVRMADQIPIQLDEHTSKSYRDINHTDAEFPVTTLRQRSSESNSEFALRILYDYKRVFWKKVRGLVNPTEYYRRTIVLADYDNPGQNDLARKIVDIGGVSIVINQSGFRIFTATQEIRKAAKHKDFKGLSLNQKLHHIYDSYAELQNTPLFVIGNRKVDRALTYHDARLDGPAFLFTDFICGNVDSLAKAVQAVGRMHGKIGECPEYCGRLRFWIDNRTRERVLRQVRIVQDIEENSFTSQNIHYMYSSASERAPEEEKYPNRDIREIGPFNTVEELLNGFEQGLGRRPVFHPEEMMRPYASNYYLSGRLRQYWGIGIREQTAEHRLVLNKENPELEHPYLYSDVPLTTSVNRNTEQNFVVLPVYENENSVAEDVKWIGRYEEPMRDKKGVVLVVGDNVLYEGMQYTISEIHLSDDGEPSKAVLKNSSGEELKMGEEKLYLQKVYLTKII